MPSLPPRSSPPVSLFTDASVSLTAPGSRSRAKHIAISAGHQPKQMTRPPDIQIASSTPANSHCIASLSQLSWSLPSSIRDQVLSHLTTNQSSATGTHSTTALEVIQGLGWIWKGGRGGGEGWRGGGLEDGRIAGEDRLNQFGLFRTTALPQPTWEDVAPLPSSVQLSAASSAHWSTPRCPHLLLVSPSHPPYKLGPSNSWCKTAPVAKVEKTSRRWLCNSWLFQLVKLALRDTADLWCWGHGTFAMKDLHYSSWAGRDLRNEEDGHFVFLAK
ncbi:hypothetical protein BJ741DRAFT_649601 [Chytriomyces cf. hyalinus JEL632]|nr:hypothetical protein BJ741DRAFT_649601 [Chytriomyces cf. hyalinus JEL632]